MQLVLSTFSNFTDVLGRGFQENGFCVVSCGDLDSGQDIQDFHPTPDKFEGVIGGPPCTFFSTANRTSRNIETGMILVNEFLRVVKEANPNWFLLENVPSIPDIELKGYHIQRFNLAASECGGNVRRNRKFQFGSKNGLLLNIERDTSPTQLIRTVTASESKQGERRSFEQKKVLQGINYNLPLSRFTESGKTICIGNAVHLFVARKLAAAIRDATGNINSRCVTNSYSCRVCGAEMPKSRKTCSQRCRKRLERNRKRDAAL